MFNSSSVSIKREIINILINANEKYYENFKLSENGKKEYERKINYNVEIICQEIKNTKDYNKIINNFIFSAKNKELFEKFVEKAYKSQRGNNLLLITFFAQNKIGEKGFIEKLEKNYGIYLEVDNFIKEMKQKLEEVKSYNQLFKYIGSEFGKNETDVEIIRKAYKKAKFNGYVERTINFGSKKREINNINNLRGGFRGRGRGRERRGF